MTSLLPWPGTYLETWRWSAVEALLGRCRELHEQGGLAATLMLVGEGGLGREAMAVELACIITCREERTLGCQCSSCQRLRRGVHPDLAVLDVATGKSDIVMEQVQEVVDGVLQRPYEAPQRVFIVANAHTPPLNAHAASAFLKTLEEPPNHVTFILLASNPARVLPTITSRSVQLRVPTPRPDELVAHLGELHGIDVEQATKLITQLGDRALAVRCGPDAASSVAASLQELLSAILAGDTLAMLRLASLIKRQPLALPQTTGALLSLASTSHPQRAEAALETAAVILANERRRAALHLDAESSVVGALAPLLRGRR